MANSYVTPNMNLPIPVPTVDPGPDWANNINSSLTILDSHNHSSGSGVQVTPSGLNINASLPMNGQSLISIGALTFQALSVDAGVNSLYEKGVDLYYRDGSGNIIRITQSGSVSGATGTITGLPSGTASASFSASTFTFQSATATGANIDGASYILRNSTASSKGLTLQPPNAMGADYSLTLPSIPAQTNVVTLDTSGNLSSVTWNTVASNRTRSTGTTVSAGGVAISTSCGAFTTTSLTPVSVTNLSVTITTSGRPIWVALVPDGSSSGANFDAGSGAPLDVSYNIRIYNSTSSAIVAYELFGPANNGSNNNQFYSVPVQGVDTHGAGTYTFIVQLWSTDGVSIGLNYCRLIAYEL